MSGTLDVPGTITIEPAGAPTITISPTIEVPEITIANGGSVSNVNPLASEPGQDWSLTTSGWVQYVPPAWQNVWALEDGAGVIALEDGRGVLAMEA